MSQERCAACSKKVYRSLLCSNCRTIFNVDAKWIRQMIQEEKRWRNMLERDQYHNVYTLSEITIETDDGTIDGWDMVYDTLTEGDNALTIDPYEDYDEDEWIAIYIEHEPWAFLDDLANHYCIRHKLLNALKAYAKAIFNGGNKPMSAKKAAELISKWEGRKVTATAYRQRLKEVRKKLKPLKIYRAITHEIPIITVTEDND